jgi:diguanylate cyclase (GGDEF)-like protein
MAVNLILAIALMKLIGQRIVNRIKLLTLNSQLLAEGKPLSGELKEGKDEIAALDKTFRLMAQELKDAMEREAIQARTDLLSGLQNRRAFLETSEQFIALGQRTKQELSIMICDIDHFKSINDRYGHGVGDEAIKAMAEAIKSVVRRSDFAARWGGEEFILGMPNTDKSGAMMLAERLRATVENISLAHETGAIRFTTSIGVASFDANHEGFEQCIQRADGALYRAKQQGRNRVTLADEDGTLRIPLMFPPA